MGVHTNKKPGFLARLNTAARYVFNASRYDNARNDYPGLWRNASLDSIDQGANHATRQTLRARARYTVVNNAFAMNAAKILAGATVGACPRLQLTSSKHGSKELAEIEKAFSDWANEVNLPDKLRRLIYARFVDGEAFAQFCLNKRVNNRVKLDLMLFDADRVTSSATFGNNPNPWTDGIKLDSTGAAYSYRVLKTHPAEGFSSEAVEIPANRVVHLFRRQFPEQHRGVTELQSALDLFMLLDRYTKAAVIAAETAADISVVFHSAAVADLGAGDSLENKRPFYEMPWRKGTTLTLPEGWEASQIKAEQPTESYAAFVSSVLNQIGAAVGVPKILLQGSAENSNYSSARLDLQSFNSQIKIDRNQLTNVVLFPLFNLWVKQYAAAVGKPIEVNARFYFDQFATIDPEKEARAARERLESGTSNLSLEFARFGLDWEEQVRQRAKERELLKTLGIEGGSNGNDYRAGGTTGNNDKG